METSKIQFHRQIQKEEKYTTEFGVTYKGYNIIHDQKSEKVLHMLIFAQKLH